MNVVTNPQSSSITFYCPNHIKNGFDELVRFKRISRTSIINHLMENWLRKEYQQLKVDEQMVSVMEKVKEKNQTTKPLKQHTQKSDNKRPLQWSIHNHSNSRNEPPMIPSMNDWEDDLLKL